MQHLFTPAGKAKLQALLGRHPLMAFDFDGTLTPIVAHPDDARISATVATRLAALAERLPVAIVTGRAIADVRERLGFEPRFVIGNHGAEDELDPAGAALHAAALDGLRGVLRARTADLNAAGVLIEDKGQSIALHYRLAQQRNRALELIHDVLLSQRESLQVFAGKMVVNATQAGTPDKAQAVHALVARCGAATAFFAGDDVNDEPVFASAPEDWLTLRVGRDGPASRARFCLEGPEEMIMLLDHIGALCDANAAAYHDDPPACTRRAEVRRRAGNEDTP
jgi:trehalose 6-phosphate phosphatase